MNSDFFTVKQLADELGVSQAFAYRYLRTKKIRYFRVGKLIRILRSDFKNFVESGILHEKKS